MKSIILTGIMLLGVCMAKAQISNLIPNYRNPPAKITIDKSGNKPAADDASKTLADNLPFIRIGGLGSLSNAASKLDIDPTASIGMEFSIPGTAGTGFDRNFRLYLNYNIGSSQDSSNVDSIKLGSFFFPDKSKSGFSASLTCDLFRLIPGMDKYSIQTVGADSRKATFYTLEPYIEYAYLLRNVKDLKSEVPRIESNTWLLGMRASLQYLIDDNNFAVLFNGYRKWISFSDATYPTYNVIFQKTNGGQAMPKHNALWGVNVGLQLNKAILGFTYENLTTKGIVNTDIAGGTFILKATISADFLDFK